MSPTGALLPRYPSPRSQAAASTRAKERRSEGAKERMRRKTRLFARSFACPGETSSCPVFTYPVITCPGDVSFASISAVLRARSLAPSLDARGLRLGLRRWRVAWRGSRQSGRRRRSKVPFVHHRHVRGRARALAAEHGEPHVRPWSSWRAILLLARCAPHLAIYRPLHPPPLTTQ